MARRLEDGTVQLNDGRIVTLAQYQALESTGQAEALENPGDIDIAPATSVNNPEGTGRRTSEGLLESLGLPPDIMSQLGLSPNEGPGQTEFLRDLLGLQGISQMLNQAPVLTGLSNQLQAGIAGNENPFAFDQNEDFSFERSSGGFDPFGASPQFNPFQQAAPLDPNMEIQQGTTNPPVVDAGLTPPPGPPVVDAGLLPPSGPPVVDAGLLPPSGPPVVNASTQNPLLQQAQLTQAAISLGVPVMAAGGVVTQPTVALVGEGGPEAVVPIGGAARPGGPGPPVQAQQQQAGQQSGFFNNLRNGPAPPPISVSDGMDRFRNSLGPQGVQQAGQGLPFNNGPQGNGPIAQGQGPIGTNIAPNGLPWGMGGSSDLIFSPGGQAAGATAPNGQPIRAPGPPGGGGTPTLGGSGTSQGTQVQPGTDIAQIQQQNNAQLAAQQPANTLPQVQDLLGQAPQAQAQGQFNAPDNALLGATQNAAMQGLNTPSASQLFGLQSGDVIGGINENAAARGAFGGSANQTDLVRGLGNLNLQSQLTAQGLQNQAQGNALNAQGQGFGQAAQGFGLNQGAGQQAFNQQNQAFNALLGGQNQGFGQGLAQFQANQGAQGQDFNQQLQQAQFNNMLNQQQFQNGLQSFGAGLNFLGLPSGAGGFQAGQAQGGGGNPFLNTMNTVLRGAGNIAAAS